MKRLGEAMKRQWDAFRAWQEKPMNYSMDETEHVCNNCGHTFRGNYCPVCSQSAKHGRISWLALWQGIGQLWAIESRSGLYTLWQLLWRPGYLVRDYISGKRQVSYPPVKLLFILAAVVALIQLMFTVPVREATATGYPHVDTALAWLDTHEYISALLANCLFILPTWWLFRHAPQYPNHTIPEGFFLQVYIAILSFLFSSVFTTVHSIAIALTWAYTYAMYKQLFGYGYWGTLWRLMVCALCCFVVLIGLVIFVMVIG